MKKYIKGFMYTAFLIGISVLGFLFFTVSYSDSDDESDTETVVESYQNPNENMIISALDNDFEMIQSLIANGADPNFQNNEDGITALHYAAAHDNVRMIQFLLDNGANIDIASYNGETPLYSALDQNAERAVELLLQRGADPFLENNNGENCFQKATHNKRMNAILSQYNQKRKG